MLFNWDSAHHIGADGFGVGGSSLTSSFGIQLFSESSAYDVEVTANYNMIQEWALPVGNDHVLYTETGLWNITSVPEPCAGALLALGAGAWVIKRRRAPCTSGPT